MTEIENAERAPFAHLDFVVQPFDKATGQAVDKEIGDFIEEVGQSLEERLKTGDVGPTGRFAGIFDIKPVLDYSDPFLTVSR